MNSPETFPSSLPGFAYETRISTVALGSARFQFRRLASLEATINSLFEALQRAGDEGLLETLCPYFGDLWPAALGLSQHLLERRPTGQRSLELGCGLALPSFITATVLGYTTALATDSHPEVPRFLAENCALNGDPAAVRHAHWDWTTAEASIPEAVRTQGPYDLILGSDVLYEGRHPENLARALAALAQNPALTRPTTRFLISDPGRGYLQTFVNALRAHGFVVTDGVITAPAFAPEEGGVKAKDVFVLDARLDAPARP